MNLVQEKLNAALASSALDLDPVIVRRVSEFELRVLGDNDPNYIPVVDQNETILDRFRVFGLLGRGGQGTTFLAYDFEGAEWVVVKELRINAIEGWKGVELFEREAQVLEQLDHRQIPKYIDATSFEDKGTVRFVLVQSFVNGDDLAVTHAEKGVRWTEEQATDFLDAFVPVLRYLHNRSTPIVHRDIKPSNIIVDSDGVPNLVDFGAVQNALPKTVGGSTIIGTSGYVPLEQYMGRATPASDIYALGATIVHMLSGVAPSDMDVVRGRLNFEKYVNVSDEFAAILARMLEPIDDDRAQSVDDLAPPEEMIALPPLSELVEARPNKLVPIASTSGNVVQFRDRENEWVDIESRDEGQRLDRFVRAFPHETRLIVQPDTVKFERRISPFGWKFIVIICVMILASVASFSSSLVYVVLPLLIMAVIRLFRVQTVEVYRTIGFDNGSKVKVSNQKMAKHLQRSDTVRGEVSIPNIGIFPLSDLHRTVATETGVTIHVGEQTYKVPIMLSKKNHQYFVERFDSAIDRIRNHEEIDPLDIW